MRISKAKLLDVKARIDLGQSDSRIARETGVPIADVLDIARWLALETDPEPAGPFFSPVSWRDNPALGHPESQHVARGVTHYGFGVAGVRVGRETW